jgi:carboxyl-terminal processing protease
VTFDHDLVILINEGSASASEILAGALRYHKDAKIVGKTSYGKGSIQTLVNLSDMSNLKITVSNWVMPNDKLIEGIGIKPDYEVSNEEAGENEDPQLEKAIEIIK